MSVPFADKAGEATCKSCQTRAVVYAEADKEVVELSETAEKWEGKGYNNTGVPRYTEKQRAFAEHPNVSTHPIKAAVDAGYSVGYARSQSKALLRQMSPLITEIQAEAKKMAAISVARVQTELASMGFANVIDYFDIAEDGSIRPKQLNHLTREQAAAIQEVDVIPFTDPKTGLEVMVIGKLKLADKRANLVELGKTLGMFNKVQLEDKREATAMLREVPTEALEDAENLLMNAVQKARHLKANKDAIPGDCEELPSPGAVESDTP